MNWLLKTIDTWWLIFKTIWVKYIVPVIFFFFVLFQMFLSNNFLLSHLDTSVCTYNKWNAIWYTCRLAASGRNKSHVVIANKWQKWNSLWPELDLVLYVLTRFLNTIQAVVPAHTTHKYVHSGLFWYKKCAKRICHTVEILKSSNDWWFCLHYLLSSNCNHLKSLFCRFLNYSDPLWNWEKIFN